MALLSSYRKRVPHFGQNPLGRGREWEATSASSYTSFSAKGKAKSARSVVCSNVEFVFTCTNCCEVGPKSLLKNSSFVSGHRFGDAVSSSKPYAPLGAGHRKPGLSANCLAAEGDCRHTKSFSAHCDSLDSRLQRRSPKKTLTKDARLKKKPHISAGPFIATDVLTCRCPSDSKSAGCCSHYRRRSTSLSSCPPRLA